MTDKINKIKIIITDIDGVWTDGGLYYTKDGLTMKKFQVKDGMGVNLARKNGFEVAIISGDASDFARIRGERLKIDLIYTGIEHKIEALDEICKLRNLSYDEVAFIGDEINDISVIEKVGFSAAPNDAIDEVMEIVDYRCKKNGGFGAFREFVDLIIKYKQ